MSESMAILSIARKGKDVIEIHLRGKPIENLSRDELIDGIRDLAKDLSKRNPMLTAYEQEG